MSACVRSDSVFQRVSACVTVCQECRRCKAARGVFELEVEFCQKAFDVWADCLRTAHTAHFPGFYHKLHFGDKIKTPTKFTVEF